MTTAHNLITEPLLSWRDASRRRHKGTLPAILAALGDGAAGDFPRARAHQLDPWSMFLTQLAAIALHRSDRSDPRLSEEDWRSLLLGLTDGAQEPWCLVVEDLSKPAFLQPPVPEGDIGDWKCHEHPDDLDVLVTSKSHDVKTSLISGDDVEAWALALVTLQTMQGYPGRGYNRISRMKGGYGSRPRIGLASDHSLSVRFLRDIDVLLGSWDALLHRGFRENGCALAWLPPWDGTSSLAMPDLSPHFIEICWRARCQSSAGRVICKYTTTDTRRCLPEIDNGDAGDPWVPIERDEKGALTVGRGGFHYQLLARLVFGGDFEDATAQAFRSGDGDPMLFLASVMSRGQGKTEGLHQRALHLTGTPRRRLGRPDERAAIAKRASNNVQQARKMRSKVLFPALKKISLGENTVEDDFDARVDEVFFNDLFDLLEHDEDQAALAWERRLYDTAWMELQRAIDRCCVPSARWYQAVSDAESMFRGCLRKQFPTFVGSLVSSAPRGAAS